MENSLSVDDNILLVNCTGHDIKIYHGGDAKPTKIIPSKYNITIQNFKKLQCIDGIPTYELLKTPKLIGLPPDSYIKYSIIVNDQKIIDILRDNCPDNIKDVYKPYHFASVKSEYKISCNSSFGVCNSFVKQFTNKNFKKD